MLWGGVALQMFVFITSMNIGRTLLFPSLACQSDFTKGLNKKFSIRASFFLQIQSRNYLIPASLSIVRLYFEGPILAY